MKAIAILLIIFTLIGLLAIAGIFAIRLIPVRKIKELVILKTDPCQVETLMEARELLESGTACDPIEVRDIESGYKIADDVNEFEIHYNTINGKQPKPKYYKRNSDGIFKQIPNPNSNERRD